MTIPDEVTNDGKTESIPRSKAKLGGMWLAVLVVAFGTGLPAGATEIRIDGRESVPSAAVWPFRDYRFDPPGAVTALERSTREQVADYVTNGQLAQFTLPQGTRKGETPGKREAEALKLPKALLYQYAYGSDSELTYLRNPDLDYKVRDDVILFAPTLFGLITYRPQPRLETTLELTLEVPIELQEENQVILPDGSVVFKGKKRISLLVDQVNVTFKKLGPFDVTVGRRNYEDERLWLYDVALDGISVKYKLGDVHIEASLNREDLFDGELFYGIPVGNTDNYMLYVEYRGIEDSKLAAYAIDRDSRESPSRPLHLGARMYGKPADRFNYWIELALTRGKDERGHKLEGEAFDVGAQYRFLNLPLQPSVVLSYAAGTGDTNPDDNTNNEFRQTGLQSNEGRFSGVTQFKTYGEMLDPELTNLRILTAGVGFRPAGNTFVDLVYHHYRTDELWGEELFSSSVTALLNQDDMNLSKDVGDEFDIILGFRNLFGLRRFGFEMRAGMFFPGKAYRIEEGDPDSPSFRRPDKAFSMLAVIIL